jgi:D-aminopeptidase
MSAPASRTRPRELGVHVGALPSGPLDAITDVAGVRVGHATVWHDTPFVARTGVTAVVPAPLGDQFERPMSAGVAVLNGAGELTGSIEIREWGLLETPIVLTNTMGVGAAYQGVVEAMLAASPRVGVEDVVIPVVGECDDSWLHDARGTAIDATLTRVAIDGATSGAFDTGVVGAGTGMICCGCKGGIGSASRVTADGTVGAIVLANFGDLARLTVVGEVVGPRLVAAGLGRGDRPEPAGSCIVVLATDAPLTPHQCERLARRAGLGLGRIGSTGSHGSGEIFIAFSTTARTPRFERGPTVETSRQSDCALDRLFEAAVDATESAVLDALFSADTVTGRNDRTIHALPIDAVLG